MRCTLPSAEPADGSLPTNYEPNHESSIHEYAIGLIETKGLVGLIEATDAMAKAANVQIVKRIAIGGGLVTTVVTRRRRQRPRGGRSRRAGRQQVGELVGSHVIPRPAEGLRRGVSSA